MRRRAERQLLGVSNAQIGAELRARGEHACGEVDARLYHLQVGQLHAEPLVHACECEERVGLHAVLVEGPGELAVENKYKSSIYFWHVTLFLAPVSVLRKHNRNNTLRAGKIVS